MIFYLFILRWGEAGGGVGGTVCRIADALQSAEREREREDTRVSFKHGPVGNTHKRTHWCLHIGATCRREIRLPL